MLLSTFEPAIFLQSLGWGLANSLWQAAFLWIVYQLISKGNKQLPAVFKYQLSLLLMASAFCWFIVTTIQNYFLLKNTGTDFTTTGSLYISNNLHAAFQGISILYFTFLLFYALRFIQGFSGVYFMRNRQLNKPPVDIRLFTEQTALHIGISKKVSIWLSENVDVPSVTGFFKPIILLPVAMLNNLTATQAESVILHELAHIKRNDYIINLLQTLVELVLFFNPFIRLLGNAARLERENCCDDWVLNYKYNKHDYAAALLVLEKHRKQPVNFVLAATNGKKNLLSRIKRLFAAEPQVRIGFHQQIKLAGLSLLMIAGIFFLLPVAKQEVIPVALDIKKPVIAPIASIASFKNTPGNFNEMVPRKISNNPSTETVAAPKRKVSEKQFNQKLKEVAYSTTLVNDELLKEKAPQNISMQVSEKPATANYPQLYVQVEEEQSGVKEKNTYLLELNNNNGITEVKPLILVNKKLKPFKSKLKLPTQHIKTVAKTRITS